MSLAPKRRWFRFSLRTMFLAVTVFCVWLGWNVEQVRKRDRLLRSSEVYVWPSRSPYMLPPPSHKFMPVAWSLLGARKLIGISLNQKRFTQADLEHYESMFPEAEMGVTRIPRHPILPTKPGSFSRGRHSALFIGVGAPGDTIKSVRFYC